MSVPSNRQELKDYCLRELGGGAIDINVTNEQVEDRVDEALNFFYEFHFEGVEKKYLAIKVQQADIDNKFFNLSNANTANIGTITGVTRIFTLSSQTINSDGSSFNMFDLSYQLRLNELYDFTSADYVYYELAQQHIRTLEMLFVGEIPIRYNKYSNILYCDMNWALKVRVGSFVVAEVYTIMPENNTLFWNDVWLKQYVIALIKKQWGNNLKKFKGTVLPGGLVVDGQGMYDEATAEIDALKIKVRETYEMPPQWEVG